jgi:hypothetical protein
MHILNNDPIHPALSVHTRLIPRLPHQLRHTHLPSRRPWQRPNVNHTNDGFGLKKESSHAMNGWTYAFFSLNEISIKSAG